VRFHLAVLGHPILPAALVPLTSIPTLLRPGEQRGLTVFYRDERPAHDFAAVTDAELSALLSDFVTESGNPKNERGVRQVEVSHPAEVLQEGVVLIDTPGIGSTFTHNTETTLRFLPECDAALFVVSADPPITEVEVQFLKRVRSHVARLFFVLNKADYLSEAERPTAVSFFQAVLREELSIDPPQVFCVSTRLGVEAANESSPEK